MVAHGVSLSASHRLCYIVSLIVSHCVSLCLSVCLTPVGCYVSATVRLIVCVTMEVSLLLLTRHGSRSCDYESHFVDPIDYLARAEAAGALQPEGNSTLIGTKSIVGQ